MSFRRDNKRKREQELAFHQWLSANQPVLARAGLPACVLQSRDDWAYFLQYRYHDHGNWNTPPFTGIDFTWEELSAEQQEMAETLEVNWNEFLRSQPILAERLPAQKLS